MSPRSSRRRFNFVLAAVAGASLVGPNVPLVAVPSWEAKALLRQLIDLVGVPDPRAIGEAYLASLPGPTALPQLMHRALVAPADFQAQQSADFAAHRLVRVDGWRLAEIDAQLCAIAALLET